jgi:phosphoserine phosphatase
MNLALFDLDNTLLNGDSDHIWGVFLAEIGVVDANSQVKAQDKFYQQYIDGTLDIHEFLEFQFKPLKENSLKQLERWRDEYIESHIKPLISQERIDLVKRHQDKGDETIVITATNSFITRPIVDLFNIQHLIATEPEKDLHGFTGKL